MRLTARLLTLALVVAGGAEAQRGPAVAPLAESGFKSIFDGKSLAGWDCDSDFWRVTDGGMVGETTADHQPKQNIFCIWKGRHARGLRPEVAIQINGCDGK